MTRRGTVRQDPKSGLWYFVVDVAPLGARRRQVRRRGFATKRDALTELTKVQHSTDRGTFVVPGRKTVSAYFEEWLAAQRARLRPSTLASYGQQLRLHILPRIGEARLQMLSAKDLDLMYADLLTDGRRDGRGALSHRTVRYCHAIIRKALRDALRKGEITRNVADLADPPSVSAARASEMATWSPAELRSFLDLITDEALAPLFRVAAMTGMRRGEVCGLKWSDIDLDTGAITVLRQVTALGREVRFGDLKTESARRHLDLDHETTTILQAHRSTQLEQRLAVGADWHDHDLVFPAGNGSPIHPDRVGKTFDRLVRTSGLRRLRFHDLRHTHATHLIAAGVHSMVVSERLGHASVAFTLTVYGHVAPGLQASAARAVAELVDRRDSS